MKVGMRVKYWLAALALLAVPGFGPIPAQALSLDQYQVPTEDARVIKMYQEVEDTYKAFSGDWAYVSKYDVTYRNLSYTNGFSYRGVSPIAYYSGTYRGWNGKITLFKCQYNVW